MFDSVLWKEFFQKSLLSDCIFCTGIIFISWAAVCNMFRGNGYGTVLQFLFFWSHMFVSILAACSNCQGTISLAFALYFINEPLFEFIQLIQTQFKKWLQPTRLRLLFECRRLAFRRTRWPRKALLRATTYLSPLFLSKMKDADLDLQDKGRVKFKCWSWVQSCASGMLLFKSFHSLITTVPSAIFNFFCQIFCEVIGALKLVSLSHISTRKAVILLLLVFLLNCTVATAMDAETSQSSGGANTVVGAAFVASKMVSETSNVCLFKELENVAIHKNPIKLWNFFFVNVHSFLAN